MSAPHSQPLFGVVMPKGAWNPGDKAAQIVLTNSNLTAICNNSLFSPAVRGYTPHSTGKWYFEITTGASFTGFSTAFGITTLNTIMTDGVCIDRLAAALASKDGTIYVNNVIKGNYAGGNPNPNYSGGTILNVAVDLVNMQIWFRYENSAWNYSGALPTFGADPANNVKGIDISSVFTSFAAYPVFCTSTNGNGLTVNFGATAFVWPPPTGFLAWG